VWFVTNGKTDMATTYSTAREIVLRFLVHCLRTLDLRRSRDGRQANLYSCSKSRSLVPESAQACPLKSTTHNASYA
jgi:hypothetical protein